MPNTTQRSRPAHNLPRQRTPFINRTQELAELQALLADSACALLTLVGPGGIGKTRLALEAAQTILDLNATDHPNSKIQNPKFDDGVFFVNLQSVGSATLLTAAVAEALGLSLTGQRDPESQVLAYLADKEMLLLLDNVEHLLPALIVPLTKMLGAALGVKLLVTSRTVLNLREEWVYPVPGLPYPLPHPVLATAAPTPDDAPDDVTEGTGDAGNLLNYAAVRLFVEQAQRLRRDFVLAAEQAGIIRICQLVEGIPLALELAAAWTKTLSCAAIAQEIERNLEFLMTPLHNMPAQHRSLRAVFEQSWTLLTGEEQQVFQRLAIFRNGFQRAAAEAIAGATLSTLSALVDKSLIYRKAENRYQIHELLRQYAEERLLTCGTETAQVQQAHSRYYSTLLQQRVSAMSGGNQQQATAELSADDENIRTAWQWLLDHAAVEQIGQAAFALIALYTFRSRYYEGVAVLGQSVRAIRLAPSGPAQQRALASTLVGLGWMHIRLGQLTEAQRAFEESQLVHTVANLLPQAGLATDPLLGLGVLALTRGDYAAALTLGEEARRRSVQHDHRPNRPIAWYILAQAAQAQGQEETAAHYAQQAYAATQATQDRWFMAYCLVTLGDIACAQETYAAAAHHYQAAYQLRAEFQDPEGMAHALYRLGAVALRQGAYTEAQQLFERSLAIYQTISDRGGRAWVRNGLGLAAAAAGDPTTARQHLAAALHIAVAIHYLPLLLDLCVNSADPLLQQDEPTFAVALLVCALRHPACGREAGDRARRLLDHWRTQLPPALFAQARQQGQMQDLDTMTARLQTQLALPLATMNKPVHGTSNGGIIGSDGALELLSPVKDATKLAQPLIEPLTERELEVLHLLTDGCSNAEIAEQLVLAVGTVKFYTAQIYGKLGVRNRTQASLRARDLHLLPAAPTTAAARDLVP